MIGSRTIDKNSSQELVEVPNLFKEGSLEKIEGVFKLKREQVTLPKTNTNS